MPRVKVTEETVFKFEELSERAKERARDWFRECTASETFWSESVIEDAATIADLLGLDLRDRAVKLMGGGMRTEPAIFWSGFSCQGDGACFEGTFRPRADAIAAVKGYAPVDAKLASIAADVESIYQMTRGLLVAVIRHSGHYYHEHSMGFEFEYPDMEDDSESIPADTLAQAEDLTQDAMRAFAKWIYRKLESAYTFANSAESIDENILANEYEFTEDGKIA